MRMVLGDIADQNPGMGLSVIFLLGEALMQVRVALNGFLLLSGAIDDLANTIQATHRHCRAPAMRQ